MSVTEAQHEMLGALDDAIEHVAWEFDYEPGIGTCGFARITNIDGRSSFVRRVKSLAESDYTPDVYEARNGGYIIDVGSLTIRLRRNDYEGCYQLSVTNVQYLVEGADYQRIDVQETIHDLLVRRLNSNGYIPNARVTSRVD